MDTINLRMKLSELKDQTWQIARESLDQGDTLTYRTLTDFAERLTRLLAPLPNNKPADSEQASPTLIPIFARYKGTRYEGQLDPARNNGGRGHCALFDGEWRTASGAARHITKTMVNGWRFWKYIRKDGSIGLIDELIKQR
jgi:hypothetical protein